MALYFDFNSQSSAPHVSGIQVRNPNRNLVGAFLGMNTKVTRATAAIQRPVQCFVGAAFEAAAMASWASGFSRSRSDTFAKLPGGTRLGLRFAAWQNAILELKVKGLEQFCTSLWQYSACMPGLEKS